MVSVSKYQEDTENTAPHVSVSWIHYKSIFPNPGKWVYGPLAGKKDVDGKRFP